MRLVGGFFLFMMALAHGRTAPSHLAPDCVLIGTVDGRVVCLDAQAMPFLLLTREILE